jgi:uncharacterized membrane protein YvbJ
MFEFGDSDFILPWAVIAIIIVLIVIYYYYGPTSSSTMVKGPIYPAGITT